MVLTAISKVIQERNELKFFISHAHLAVGIDAGWLGVNVYKITDLPLLVEWWNKTIRYAGDPVTKEVTDKALAAFHSALWVRINMLHPKERLCFADITRPEMVRKYERRA